MKKRIISLFSFSVGALIAFYSLTLLVQHKELTIKDDILSLQADYITYDGLNELEKDVDVILIGKPIEEFIERKHFNVYGEQNGLEDFYTETEIQVTQVIKGQEKVDKEKSLKVIEPITYLSEDKLTITTAGYSALAKDVHYLIFLKKNDFGDLAVVFEGKYNVDSSDTLNKFGNEVIGTLVDTESGENDDSRELNIWGEIQVKYQEYLNRHVDIQYQ